MDEFREFRVGISFCTIPTLWGTFIEVCRNQFLQRFLHFKRPLSAAWDAGVGSLSVYSFWEHSLKDSRFPAIG